MVEDRQFRCSNRIFQLTIQVDLYQSRVAASGRKQPLMTYCYNHLPFVTFRKWL